LQKNGKQPRSVLLDRISTQAALNRLIQLNKARAEEKRNTAEGIGMGDIAATTEPETMSRSGLTLLGPVHVIVRQTISPFRPGAPRNMGTTPPAFVNEAGAKISCKMVSPVRSPVSELMTEIKMLFVPVGTVPPPRMIVYISPTGAVVVMDAFDITSVSASYTNDPIAMPKSSKLTLSKVQVTDIACTDNEKQLRVTANAAALIILIMLPT
jgi:hypothetical protein